jgi:hypothetical protein
MSTCALRKSTNGKAEPQVIFDSYADKLEWLKENPPACKVPGTDSLRPQGYWEGTRFYPASYREMGHCDECPRRGMECCLFPHDDSPEEAPEWHHHGRSLLGHDEVIEKLILILEERGEIKTTYLLQPESPISYSVVHRHFGGIKAARAAVMRRLERGA